MTLGAAPATVLILGAAGQLGRALSAAAWPANVQVRTASRADADLAADGAAARLIRAVVPDLVVNAAAYTAVDLAETDPAPAWRLNRDLPAELATATADIGAALVHVSTDYVFDGTKGAPYVESDPVNPLNVYGASKAAGEAAAAANPRHLIIRTAWLHAAVGHNFVRTMARLACERERVDVVDDQRGAPTAAADLAAAIIWAAARTMSWPISEGPSEGAPEGPPPWGLYHFSGAGETTWHGVAARIFDRLAARGLPRPTLAAISSRDRPGGARRPADSRLDHRRFAAAFGWTPPPWEAGVDAVLDQILAGAGDAPRGGVR